MCILIVLGFMPSLFGDNENIASDKIDSPLTTLKKTHMNTELCSDIERPLLRPVKFKNEDGIANEQQTLDLSSGTKSEQSIENIVSILVAERKKLQELESEYRKLKKDIREEDNSKANKISVNKEIESLSTLSGNEHLQSNDESAKIGTSTAVVRIYPLNDERIQDGSSTVQRYITKGNKKTEANVSNDINQRLSKVIGNMSLLDLAECFYKLCEYDNALQTYKLITPDDNALDQYIWAQYQIANCYRNMKKFNAAVNEYQHFVNQYPGSNLIEQAKWYMDDINWWKSWYEKNTLANNQLVAASNSRESK